MQVADALFAEFTSTQTEPLQSAESISRFSAQLATQLLALGSAAAIAQCGDLKVRGHDALFAVTAERWSCRGFAC